MTKFGTEYDRLFSRAIEILRSSGRLETVREYISSIEDQDYRDVTLSKVGVFLAEQNRADEGMQFAKEIGQPMERADALLSIARRQAERGHRAEAKVTLMGAVASAEDVERSTWETPSILLQVSQLLYEVDFGSEALPLLRRAIQLAQKGADFDSAKVIGGAAALLARWGFVDEAISAADLISQSELRIATKDRLKEILP